MSREQFFLLIILLMSVQLGMGIIQVKRYQKELKKLRGTGTVGLGHTKGGFKPGQIVIISYKAGEDRVVAFRRMRGMTIFAGFKTDDKMIGLNLDTLRQKALQEDAREFARRRKKHPYNPKDITKKKGAMIQAVEAIDNRLATEKRKLEQAKRIEEHKRIESN
ncbi:MAG: transcriptional regulator [Eubacteriaceae bacterium]|jgi:glucitol operon activator protein|nr:transcriptional regulator [Eubacteriaceae bacterium]